MKKIFATMLVTAALALTLAVRADDLNPEVAKTIQEIAARRAEKEAARAKQAETWQKQQGQQRGGWNGAPGAGVGAPAAPAK